jgi:hypothetical protein
MKIPSRLLAAFAAVVLVRSAGAAADPVRVSVAAADVDRLVVTASMLLPSSASPRSQLRDAAGRIYPLQVEANGLARFVIPQQRAGESIRLTLVDGSSGADQVAVARSASDLGINVAGQGVLAYQMDRDQLPRADIDVRYKRAAYLHPVRSPSGAVVTGNFPANHPHHHGIWSSWSKVQFQGRATNFWETVEQKGNTEFVGLERSWSGAVHGGFVARQQMIDLTGGKSTAAVNETWEVTVLAVEGVAPAARVFDLVITQAAASADPVVFPKYHYGGTSFRGRDEWNGKDNLVVLTSEGATTRDTANMSRVRWVYFGGVVEGGRTAGLAILSHPDNLHSPQPIRVHPEMPYVCFAPVQLGDIRLEPGQSYVARYRYVVTDGAPDRARLDAYWNGYARPANVTLDAR